MFYKLVFSTHLLFNWSGFSKTFASQRIWRRKKYWEVPKILSAQLALLRGPICLLRSANQHQFCTGRDILDLVKPLADFDGCFDSFSKKLFYMSRSSILTLPNYVLFQLRAILTYKIKELLKLPIYNYFLIFEDE